MTTPLVSDETASPAPLANRRVRWAEIGLVLVVSFYSSVTSSIYNLLTDYAYAPKQVLAADPPITQLFTHLQALGQEAISLGLLVYVLFRQGRRLSDLGFRFTKSDFLWSLLVYAIAFLTYYAIYTSLTAIGLYTPHHSQGTGSRVPAAHFPRTFYNSALQFAYFVINPFREELIIRAYFQSELTALTGNRVNAVLLPVIIQTIYHLHQGVGSAFGYSFFSLIFGLYYQKTGRIWPVILAHLYDNIGQFLWIMYGLD